jgi:nicotinamide riboside transporter PnuC
VPGYDSFNTALNIVGTWILGRKVIEVWGVWFVANVASVLLYVMRSNVDGTLYESLSNRMPHWVAYVIAQDMLSSVLLYVVYTLASVYGFCKWLRCGVRIG